jgi:hypothetical protein
MHRHPAAEVFGHFDLTLVFGTGIRKSTSSASALSQNAHSRMAIVDQCTTVLTVMLLASTGALMTMLIPVVESTDTEALQLAQTIVADVNAVWSPTVVVKVCVHEPTIGPLHVNPAVIPSISSSVSHTGSSAIARVGCMRAAPPRAPNARHEHSIFFISQSSFAYCRNEVFILSHRWPVFESTRLEFDLELGVRI